MAATPAQFRVILRYLGMKHAETPKVAWLEVMQREWDVLNDFPTMRAALDSTYRAKLVQKRQAQDDDRAALDAEIDSLEP